jgi:hypothetical protein
MEITSKLSKWRKVAAHLSHVPRGRTLSLERFLSKRGVLVIQTDEEYREQHSAINAMLLQRLGQILMKMQPDPTGKRKVYIVIDEFPSLGYIEGMVEMFRELRSRGVVFLVIWQSWANMEAIWKEKAYSIQNTLQNFMILGSGDPKDAEHAAKLIGKIRGWEAERGESTSDGSNIGASFGESDQEGTSIAQTRVAGTKDFDKTPYSPPPTYTSAYPAGGGFTATDTLSKSKSKGRNAGVSFGKSHQETKSVTYRYFERDIMTPTEIMRMPWPTPEGGFHGIGYCVGEPEPNTFVYESEFLERAGVFEKHDHIPDYVEWPSEKFQLLEDLSKGELERLGLDDVDPAGDGILPKAADDPREDRPQPSNHVPEVDDDPTWNVLDQ